MAYVDITSQVAADEARKQARRDALQGQIVEGLKGFADIERQKKAEERQAAMDAINAQNREIKLAQMGYVSPERQGELQAEQVSSMEQAQAQPDFVGPMQPTQEASQKAGFAKFLTGVADRAQAERWAEQERAGLRSQLLQSQIDESQLPFEQTREYAKMQASEKLGRGREQRQFARQKELEGIRQAGRKELAGLTLMEKRKQKVAEQKGKAVPGYKSDSQSGVEPTSMEVRQFRTAISDANAFKNNISNVEKIIKENEGVPSALFSPNTYNRMQQEMTKAKLDLKGEAFFKLGVLAGPDMELIDKTFGEIDGLFGTWQPGNEKVALEKLKAIKDYVDNKVNSKAQSLGYTRDVGQVKKEDLANISDAELDALINQTAGR